MSVIVILILASLGVAATFLGGFIWAVKSGQFEDTLTPSMRILAEDSRASSTEQAEGHRSSDGDRSRLSLAVTESQTQTSNHHEHRHLGRRTT
jgi:cbb3-type cytochrome oxidase maturation protein